jgi:O-6-methylguanine DNA methyltransferase
MLRKWNGVIITGFLAKGHRGLVYAGRYKRKDVALKLKNPKSMAHGRMANEANWLYLLNQFGIGPKKYLSSANGIVMEFIDGVPLQEWLAHKPTVSRVKRVINELLEQCFVMDLLGVAKEEMHHPYKHVLVRNNIPVLIDFERCHHSRKPKNVTQCCQYFSRGLRKQLREYSISPKNLLFAMKQYKKNISLDKFNQIKKSLKLPLGYAPLYLPFRQRVYRALLLVPPGKVTTYGAIARFLGSRAYQAIGQALKANPCAPAIPCHRVIASDGSLGGYGGKLYSRKKAELLCREGIVIIHKSINLSRYASDSVDKFSFDTS